MPDIAKDYEVYELAGTFHARGRIDSSQLATSGSATETIQAAIDALGNGGGEVRLHRGVYPLDAPLKLADSATLRGCGRASRLAATAKNKAGIEMINVRAYSVQGNTLFNWCVAPPMRIGIREDGDGFKSIIDGNNINYYKEEAVRSEGKETTVGENVGYAEHPHQGWDHNSNLQTFHTQLTREFIALQTDLEEN